MAVLNVSLAEFERVFYADFAVEPHFATSL